MERFRSLSAGLSSSRLCRSLNLSSRPASPRLVAPLVTRPDATTHTGSDGREAICKRGKGGGGINGSRSHARLLLLLLLSTGENAQLDGGRSVQVRKAREDIDETIFRLSR